MLSILLSKSECAACKFCCSFRRQSLWETPVFEWRERLDLLPQYKTDDPEEEVPCPYLVDGKGCTLSDDKKPFDCKIWPLRVVHSKDDENPALSPAKNLRIVLEPTCPAISKLPLEQVRNFVNTELKEKILSYASEHPEIVKEDSDFFIKL